MRDPQSENLIIELIKNHYKEGKINLKDVESIAFFCEELVSNEKEKKQHDQYVSLFDIERVIGYQLFDTTTFLFPLDSTPFSVGAKEPKLFIDSFKESFQDKYERTSHIRKNVAKELFSKGNDKIVISLGQIKDEIIFCVEDNNKFYIINDTDKLIEVDSNCIDFFDKNFGVQLDLYLQGNDPLKTRNTRKFEITKNVYEYLIKYGFGAIVIFPAVCMDDSINNPAKESYKYRFTYMMTFGDEDEDFREFPNVLIFDRNGLCPPGNC